MAEMKKISIMVPTYNEEENVIPLSEAIIEQFNTNETLKKYDYEILFIDNCSHDTTREKLQVLCASNPKIRAIFNVRNFGQFNSPYYGICQTSGDCTIPLCADFQDPVEMIATLVEHWEKGYKIVCAVKTTSKENQFIRFLRTCYYKLIKKMSDVEQIEHFTGFGLYDRSFVEVLCTLDDPTPFIRGIVAELGFSKIEIPYEQAARRAGKTSNNFARLYDAAMLSFTTYTKTAIRFMTFFGVILFALNGLGFLGCSFAFILSLLIGLSGFGHYFEALWIISAIGAYGSVNFVFLGLLGEYILTIKSKIMKRPLVIEEKRINFD